MCANERNRDVSSNSMESFYKRELDILEDLTASSWNAIETYQKRQSNACIEYNSLRKSGMEYQRVYRKIVSSRFFKVWMTARSLRGKRYTRQGKIDFPPKSWITGAVNTATANEYARILGEVDDIRDSNGSSYFGAADLNIGIITDQFIYDYYEGAVNALIINDQNYKDVIDAGDLAAVLFVTGWRGMHENGLEYEGGKGLFARNDGLDIAESILSYARKRNITTIFQSIEDPPNYEHFLKVAKVADVILTTAEEMVPFYKKDTGNERVFFLAYGVNPHMHNPVRFLWEDHVPVDGLQETVLFAGSWAKKYPDRCRDVEMLLDGVLDAVGFSLAIADRNLQSSYHVSYEFPVRYSPYVMPPFEHDDLQKVHKMVDWTINVNSVSDSTTMCAMRVYEVQALGCLLLSNYALSVSNAFPGVFTVLDSDEIPRILEGYSRREIVNMQMEGIRDLYNGHTVYDRLNRVFDLTGIGYRFPEKPVYVVCPEVDDAMREALENQSLSGVVLLSEEEAREKLSEVNSGYAVKWDGSGTNDHHLLDMLNAFKFTDVGYACYTPEERWTTAYDYVEDAVAPDDAMFDLSKVTVDEILAGGVAGQLGFSVLAPRWGRDTSATKKDLAVIVPVYNNGRFLQGRCFRSLLRSSVFDRMRIYLIDDGSTDGKTPRIVRSLGRDFENVVTYFFDDGGSGSASRPRNKGFELGDEKYVTYLDPDDEAVGDGYARLLEVMESEDVDLVFGEKLQVRAGGELVLHSDGGEGRIETPRSSLVKHCFRAQSMQAAIMKRVFLEDAHLTFVEGALGQDTLYFYEMMAAAESAWAMRGKVFQGWSDRRGSVTNSIDIEFYRKYYLVELAQVEFLRHEGLLDDYRRLRLDSFMSGWYIERLHQVPLCQLSECARIVNEIKGLYDE